MFPKILMPKKEIKVNVVSVLRKTAGKRHCWCDAETSDGIKLLIRKPIGSVKNLLKV